MTQPEDFFVNIVKKSERGLYFGLKPIPNHPPPIPKLYCSIFVCPCTYIYSPIICPSYIPPPPPLAYIVLFYFIFCVIFPLPFFFLLSCYIPPFLLLFKAANPPPPQMRSCVLYPWGYSKTLTLVE